MLDHLSMVGIWIETVDVKVRFSQYHRHGSTDVMLRWLLPLHRQLVVSKAAKINLIVPGTPVP
jgi:hypothetical protein